MPDSTHSEDGRASTTQSLDEDPAPACPPPAWAAQLVAAARARAGRSVYPPSDDTFLLLEVLAEDAARLRLLQPRICLEVGSGTGALLTGLLEILEGRAPETATQVMQTAASSTALLLAIDKNPDAVACTKALLSERGAPAVAAVRGSLTAGLRLAGLVDVGLCNPPYVPTEPEEMQGCGIEASWAGGEQGRQVIDRLLPCIATVLAPQGLFYLVCVAENRPGEILEAVKSYGLRAEIIRREMRGIEELFILRFEQEPRQP